MAQELREGDGKSGIARAGKRKWGYDPAQVDAFLERAHALYDSEGMNLTQHDIQNVSFDLRKNGYVIAQVDAALGRLERAVVDKQTTWEIAQHGRVTWKAKTEKLYHEVQNHAERNERERFKSGAPKQPSYDKKQVDRLVDQIVDKAAAALGVDGVTEDDVRSLADLNANTVNNVIFTQRKGKKGYDERQVDYFLNACVQLLSRLESYARVADFVSGEPAAPAQTATNVTVQANGVSPSLPERSARQLTNVLLRLPLLMTNHSMPCIRPSRACSLLRLRLLPQRRPRRHRSPMRRLLHRSMLPQAPIAPMRNSRFPLLPQHTRCMRPTSLRRSPSPRRLPWLLPQLLRLSLPSVPRPRRFPV